ncbi:adenine deaminase [Mucilaginibacter arboris]|uniref:Adenine deaminase n=1 Tax=Mucilaginibacter arboris TaxID=2682090 RepID=A0A7K1SZ05_9SPHI|nr:adenine deaminase [Mucilaginibacter arboris]MVN22545.1 adenine deaminase [Mucilaginibacter arboris]
MLFTLIAQLVKIELQEIYPVELTVEDGLIRSIKKVPVKEASNLPFLVPGFVDAHVHIESSMLIPSEFARLAVVHGTVGTVSDPHEIANVCGLAGVEFMLENGRTVPFKFNFGAPSCVPATTFETAGAVLNADEVDLLLSRKEIKYLSEMMNFPGVLNQDPEVMQKLRSAKKHQKPIDGHAPGLRGELAEQYIAAGISTDHECFTEEEALNKLRLGMKILIREGSAAKNFDALISLMNDYPDQMMFCSDDKHPDSLVSGHINQLCARAVAAGVDVFKVLKAASVNPVLHYKLEIGQLNLGDAADFILLKDLKDFEVIQTYINGELVAENGESRIKMQPSQTINNFSCLKKAPEDFAFAAAIPSAAKQKVTVIEALDGQLITNKIETALPVKNGFLVSDLANDVLKICVVNRYREAPVAKAFIKNFGLKEGAIASSVAHDSHNIVVVGADDESICKAVNLLIKAQGGISCISNENEQVLPLPVAGLMSADDGYKVAAAYTQIDGMAKSLGSALSAPFMTLSFMALLVIPHLKLSDLGLFDGDGFKLINQ